MPQIAISKSRTVLPINRTNTEDDEIAITFSNLNDGDAFITKKIVTIPRELWEAMGSPEEVTVSVSPGNTLTQDTEV